MFYDRTRISGVWVNKWWKKFKIPYIVLIGKEEYNSNKVSVIRYDKKDIKHYTLEEVMQRFERRR